MYQESDTFLCNLALYHIGISDEIANLNTEKSQEARACRVYFDFALRALLEKRRWNFFTEYRELNLIPSENNYEYLFKYRVPSDSVKVLRILGMTRNPGEGQRIPYKVSSDNIGKIIYTDVESAVAECIVTKSSSIWPTSFKECFSYYLAFLIAAKLTKGDHSKVRADMFTLFTASLEQAAASDANEEQKDPEPRSILERIREY